jgi:hypothetical protein
MKVIKVKKLQKLQKEYLIEQVINDKERFFDEFPNDESYTIKENDIIIPAFINIKNDTATLLWVSKEFRKKGYGLTTCSFHSLSRFLVNCFNINYTQAHYTSIPFWKSLGFSIINSKGVICMKRIKDK